MLRLRDRSRGGGGVSVGIPMTISGLKLWLDASDPSSILSTGGVVDTWADKSGNGNNATATGASRPATGTRTINSKNALDFDGSNDFMTLASGISTIGSGDNTVFVVFASDNAGDATQRLLAFLNASSGLRYEVSFTATAVNTQNRATSNLATTQSWTRDTATHIVGFRRQGVNIRPYIDGVQGTAGTNAENTATTQAYIGNLNSGGVTDKFNGLIGEILIYDSYLSEENMDVIGGYLGAKWNVTWVNYVIVQAVMSRGHTFSTRLLGNNGGRTDTHADSRIRVYAPSVNVSELRTLFTGWIQLNGSAEINIGNGYTVSAAIEDSTATNFYKTTFSGADVGTVTNGLPSLISDKASGLTVSAGGSAFIRTSLNISSITEYIPRFFGSYTVSGDAGYVSPAAADQAFGIGVISNPSGGASAGGPPMANAILGRPASPITSVFVIGDSIGDGENSSSTSLGADGFVTEGLSNVSGFPVPWNNSSVSSNRLQYQVPASSPNKYTILKYYTHVIIQAITNDIGNGRTITQIISDLQAICTEIKTKRSPYGYPLKIAICLCGPRTTSTDSFQTLANQTVHASYIGAGNPRDAYNDYILDNVGGQYFDYFINHNSVWESATDHGKWVVNGTSNYFTADGLHQNTASSTAAAAVVAAKVATFTTNGTGSDTRIPNMPTSTVMQLSASRFSSYGGSGQTFANKVLTPADGASRASYDMSLGLTTGAAADDPTFTGTAGVAGAYFSHDGADMMQLIGANTSFLDNIHKTTGGQAGWIAVAFRAVDNTNRAIIAATENTSTSLGLGIYAESNEVICFDQRGDTATAQHITGVAVTPGTDYLVIFTWPAGGGANHRRWINTRTGTDFTLAWNATTSAASAKLTLSSYGNGTSFPQSSGYRLYDFAMGNVLLNDTEAAKIFDNFNTQTGITFA